MKAIKIYFHHYTFKRDTRYVIERKSKKSTAASAVSEHIGLFHFQFITALLYKMTLIFACVYLFFLDSQSRTRVFNTLYIQYYSMICRPSDHTVGRPQAEIRTRDGRSRATRPPHLLMLGFSGTFAFYYMLTLKLSSLKNNFKGDIFYTCFYFYKLSCVPHKEMT